MSGREGRYGAERVRVPKDDIGACRRADVELRQKVAVRRKAQVVDVHDTAEWGGIKRGEKLGHIHVLPIQEAALGGKLLLQPGLPHVALVEDRALVRRHRYRRTASSTRTMCCSPLRAVVGAAVQVQRALVVEVRPEPAGCDLVLHVCARGKKATLATHVHAVAMIVWRAAPERSRGLAVVASWLNTALAWSSPSAKKVRVY